MKKRSIAHLYPHNLADMLGEYPAGMWVAISNEEQRVVGSGPTAGRAERQAQASGHKPSLVLQVPLNGFAARRKNSNGKNGNGKIEDKVGMPLNLPSFYRGVYKRVAKKLGCDPSYVSRVARGERASDAVSRALKSELNQAAVLTNRTSKLRRDLAYVT